MLNRSLIIVTPKQPYLDWALNLDDSGIAPETDDQTAYLVPDFDDDMEAGKVLKRVYLDIFERELSSWHEDESCWPKPRTLSMFREWFDVQFHSMVEDLGAEELEDDEG